ncbi:MAG: ATP-binding cassette domain-containing protein, partial [Chitinispirillaceae bacterium]|nr:ATP-binding cassette domain-containing protein [Chitinispirillaceae bacterium]
VLRHRYIKRGLSESDALNVSRERLDKVGISRGLWNMYPSTFSGGEKQRVNILLALASEPRLLLVDEPTASLDDKSKRIILELLLEAKKRGTTMIGVFHDQESIQTLADQRYVMEGEAQ